MSPFEMSPKHACITITKTNYNSDLRELINNAALLSNLQLKEFHFLFLVGVAQVS